MAETVCAAGDPAMFISFWLDSLDSLRLHAATCPVCASRTRWFLRPVISATASFGHSASGLGFKI